MSSNPSNWNVWRTDCLLNTLVCLPRPVKWSQACSMQNWHNVDTSGSFTCPKCVAEGKYSTAEGSVEATKVSLHFYQLKIQRFVFLLVCQAVQVAKKKWCDHVTTQGRTVQHQAVASRYACQQPFLSVLGYRLHDQISSLSYNVYLTPHRCVQRCYFPSRSPKREHSDAHL